MNSAGASLDRVRVVIPCRNERGYIGRCLESLIACDRSGLELEVWVCDGMSDDGTREEIAALAASHSWIKMIDNPARTTPQAMNIGLMPEGYDIGIILGAHAEVDPRFLQANRDELHAHPEAGCVGGVIENVYSDAASRRIGAAMAHPFGVGGAHFRTGFKDGEVDTVAFGAYRREVFNRVGYFDERLVRNQDDEFNFRVTRAGFRIRLNRTIRSRYHVRGTYSKLWKQYRQYGYWKVYVNRLHGTITTIRQLVPAIFILGVVLGGTCTLLWPTLLPIWLGGIGLYLLVALTSAWRAAASLGDVPGVLLAFLTLHAAYGVGYLHGLFEFMLLRREPSTTSTRLTR